MTITLNKAFDPTCRAIASFLQTELNQLDADEVVVQHILDFDGLIGMQGVHFPLLQVFRLGSTGVYLETSDLKIEYYLYDLNAYFDRPGMLRLVEVAIAQLIKDRLPYTTWSNYAKVSVTGCDRGFQKFEDGQIFPYSRLTCKLQEVNVKLPQSSP